MLESASLTNVFPVQLILSFIHGLQPSPLSKAELDKLIADIHRYTHAQDNVKLEMIDLMKAGEYLTATRLLLSRDIVRPQTPDEIV